MERQELALGNERDRLHAQARAGWGEVAITEETPVRLLTLPFRLVVVLLKLLVLLLAVVGIPYVAIPTVAFLFLARRNRA